jgi:succinoglycan biosynthesis transport protein ExoP
MAGNLLPPSESESFLPVAGGNTGALAQRSSGLMQPEKETMQLGRYWSAVKRYRWLILLLVLGGTGLGIVITRFIKPLYTVNSTIYIRASEEGGGLNDQGGVVQGQNWVQLLTTSVVLDNVVVQERLFFQPTRVADSLLFGTFNARWPWRSGSYVLEIDKAGRNWNLSLQDGRLLETGRVGSPIGAKLGMTWSPPARLLEPGRKVEFELVTPRDAAFTLRENLVTNLAREGNFLLVSLTGPDPARLARTLNAIGDQFVKQAATLKKRRTTAMASTLEEKLSSVADSLKAADARLAEFQTRTITQPSEGTAIAPGIGITQSTVTTEYFMKRTQLQQIQQDRRRLDGVLTKARAGQPVIDELQTIQSTALAPGLNDAVKSLATFESELVNLRFRFTDQSKAVQDMQEKIQTLRTQTIPGHIATLSGALRAQEAALTGTIGEQTRELRGIPQRTITEEKLKRERAVQEGIYLNLQSQFTAARLAEASSIPDVEVLDPAIEPQRPSRNSAIMIVLGAFAASFGLAVGLALLLDRLDKRLRYPDQVTKELGLSILGAIPAIQKVRADDRDAEEAAQVVEAFRTIRMNLAHSYGTAGPVLLTVSSPSPGDGKSLVSSNLALSFAEAGYRTLLIDGDIRRGELHRMFNSDRRPGLLDCLRGEASIEGVTRQTTHKNLTLIPCGTRHHHGPELLGSAAMRDMMATLKTRYNVIIIDSPPLGAGIDPFVLATATGNILLVLRSGETDRQMAEAKLKLLDRLPIRILGAVLNDIRSADSAYRHYRYVYGYTADEEPAPQLTGPSGD